MDFVADFHSEQFYPADFVIWKVGAGLRSVQPLLEISQRQSQSFTCIVW